MEIKKDGWFEFHLTEGQQFRISAYLKTEKDGQEVFFYVRHEVQIRILTVKGDVGPINITLDSVLRRKKSDK